MQHTVEHNGLDQNFIQQIISNMGSIEVAVTTSVFVIIILAVILAVKVFQINIWHTLIKIYEVLTDLVGKRIQSKEKKYDRDTRIGIYNDKTKKVKIYKFLNDLIIDLGIKKKGATPYTFLFIVMVCSAFTSLLAAYILFKSAFMGMVMFPLMSVFILCVCYTKANLAHDKRIDSVIDAENTIANAIKSGIVPAVRNNIDMIDESIRMEYQQFLDAVDQRNVYVKTALLELNNNLGSISDDFIKKCIVFEYEEEDGLAGMFQDIVELNNLKIELRNDMKRQFEEVTTQFILSAAMIVCFLGGIMAYYPFIAEFYFRNALGQLIIMLDMLLFVIEFVFLTYLRAKEL